MNSKLWKFLSTLLIFVTLFRLWHLLDKRGVEIVAYQLCFGALPSYTYCTDARCFDIQKTITYYTIGYIFDEYLMLCTGITMMDRRVVSLISYDTDRSLVNAWHSLIECMTLNAGSPDYIEDFPGHSQCTPIWVDVKKMALDVADRADLVDYLSKLDTSQ